MRRISRKRKNWGGIVLIVGMSLLVVLHALSRRYPIELAEARVRFQLWRNGVQSPVSPAEGIHYFERDRCAGADPARCVCLAMVHGMGDSALSWRSLLLAPRTEWLPEPEPFALRLLAIDLPGFGNSRPPFKIDGYRARELAHSLLRFFDQPEISSRCRGGVVLLGNSFGGWVTTLTALEWSGKPPLRALVLADASGTEDSRDPSLMALLANPTVDNLKEFQHRAYFSPRMPPDEVWEEAVRKAVDSDTGARMAAQTADDELTADRVEPLAQAWPRLSVWLVWGSHDGIVGRAQGQILWRRIRGSKWRELDHCGHLPQKECPALLLGVLREVLGSLSVPAPAAAKAPRPGSFVKSGSVPAPSP